MRLTGAACPITKFGKAYLDVPNEALKNENAKKLLHKLFSLCFSNDISPLDWSFSDIKPIPKKDKDPRDPLNNRCITIMCCIGQHSRNEVALGFKKVKKQAGAELCQAQLKLRFEV